MLRVTAAVIGAELEAVALARMAEQLSVYPLEDLTRALNLAERECKGKLPLKDILDRLGVASSTALDKGNAVAAWDIVLNLKKYHLRPISGAEGEGQYGLFPAFVNDFSVFPNCATLADLVDASKAAAEQSGVEWKGVPAKKIPVPEISERIQDTVRLLGGWARIAQMDSVNVQWVQRDFYEHYESWGATKQAIALESGEPDGLVGRQIKRLAGKHSMDGRPESA